MKSSIKKRLLWILVPVLALVVVGGAGLSWMLSGSSAAPLALKAGGSSSSAASAGDLSGQWKVVPGPANEATTAGYRVEEKVAGGLVSDTATGRTGDVTGSVTVVGSRVSAAHFTVNMTTLKSDKSLRDTVLKTNAIQTTKYPTAAFILTDPIALPDITPGKIYTARRARNAPAPRSLEVSDCRPPVPADQHGLRSPGGHADRDGRLRHHASQHRRSRIGAEPRLLRTPRESGEMKTLTEPKAARPRCGRPCCDALHARPSGRSRSGPAVDRLSERHWPTLRADRVPISFQPWP